MAPTRRQAQAQAAAAAGATGAAGGAEEAKVEAVEETKVEMEGDAGNPVALTPRAGGGVQQRLATPPTRVQTVAKPRFGNLLAGSTSVVWIGGPPNERFTKTMHEIPATPMCYRNLDASSEQKAYAKRCLEGNDLKFKRGDPNYTLLLFADDALARMQSTGMDTVFYVKGQGILQESEELFTYHTKYTRSLIDRFYREAIKDGGCYSDPHSKQALQESAKWLFNSLDSGLKSSLRTTYSKRPSGPQLWMSIVSEVQTTSLRRNRDLIKKFESLSLSNFKGENVEDYAKAVDHLLVQLERDGQLPKLHLLDIVDDLTKCTVMDFKIQWMGRRPAIDKFL